MKSVSQLFKEFKDMPLGKQSLVSVATIAIIITFLSNYKTIKQSSKSIVDKFVQDDNIKEFMTDVTKAIKSFSKVCRNFLEGGDSSNENN